MFFHNTTVETPRNRVICERNEWSNLFDTFSDECSTAAAAKPILIGSMSGKYSGQQLSRAIRWRWQHVGISCSRLFSTNIYIFVDANASRENRLETEECIFKYWQTRQFVLDRHCAVGVIDQTAVFPAWNKRSGSNSDQHVLLNSSSRRHQQDEKSTSSIWRHGTHSPLSRAPSLNNLWNGPGSTIYMKNKLIWRCSFYPHKSNEILVKRRSGK